MKPIMDWLTAQGFDRQRELNVRLCGHIRMTTEEVRALLDQGADPDWVAPNGSTVLEHAIVRYWNGEAVDLLAAHATPRKALWIAAGLGDVDGVSRFLDAHGKPTAAVRKSRPDFDAIGYGGMLPPLPDPDDEELLMEAFFIAILNGRAAVLEYMVSRGFNVNSLVWTTPIINIVVGNAMAPMVECLIRCGANLDLRGWRPRPARRASTRETAGTRLAGRWSTAATPAASSSCAEWTLTPSSPSAMRSQWIRPASTHRFRRLWSWQMTTRSVSDRRRFGRRTFSLASCGSAGWHACSSPVRAGWMWTGSAPTWQTVCVPPRNASITRSCPWMPTHRRPSTPQLRTPPRDDARR